MTDHGTLCSSPPCGGTLPLRVLWVSFHRTARCEEVGALLRCGAEVIPTTGESQEFPNPLQPPEDLDPWTPPWRRSCTVPPEVLEIIRPFSRYVRPELLTDEVVAALNEWIDVVWVGTFSRSVVALLRRFRGGVVLRAYGGYPYTASLGRWPLRVRSLDLLATSERYAFCPALPYQRLTEDVRLTRNETFIPACVTPSRLPHRWAASESDPVAIEVISLIGRYRRRVYEEFIANFGDLPVRVLGQNPPGGDGGDDPHIVGTLDDEGFYGAIARARVVLYAGLGSRYHLHYHPLEALTMGVPVVFLRSSALAQTALFLGAAPRQLREAGMCESTAEARAAVVRLIGDPAQASAMSQRQEIFRRIYSPERWDQVLASLLLRAGGASINRRSDAVTWRDSRPFGSPLDGSTVRSTLSALAEALARRIRFPRR